MDYIRQQIENAVARSRPELADAERQKLSERILETIQAYPAEERAPLRMRAAGDSRDFFSQGAAPANHAAPQPGASGLAFVALCDAGGHIAEMIHDALGLGSRLASGSDLSGIVSPFHARRLARFLRNVREEHASYDCILSVLTRLGNVRLFCSGFAEGSRTVVIGTPEPLALSIPRELAPLAAKKPALTAAMKELAAWKEKNAGPRHDSPHVPAGEIRIAGAQHHTAAGRRRLLELAAHDLRNPISGILAACQYLMEDATRVLEPHHLLVLASIESSTRVALQLVHTLAEIPTIRLNEPQIELRPTDVVSVIQEAVSAVRPFADMMRIKMHVTANDQVPLIEADPIRLSEALSGLLVKAIGPSDAGGTIEVTVGTDAGEARVALRREFAIRPSQEATRIKSRNRGLHRKLSAIYASLVWVRAKQILKAHRGAVRMENPGREGQQWTVTLPIAVRQPARHG